MEREYKDGCVRCELERTTEYLYQDDLWSIFRLLEVPGWAAIQTRRHVENFAELTEEEITSLGPLLHRLAVVAGDLMKPEKTYLAAFGDRVPHFHFAVLPRTAKMQRGGHMFIHELEYNEPDVAPGVAEEMKQALNA